MLHTLHTAHSGAEVHIILSDTGVLVLVLWRFPHLGKKTAFITGVGEKRRTILLKPIYDVISSN